MHPPVAVDLRPIRLLVAGCLAATGLGLNLRAGEKAAATAPTVLPQMVVKPSRQTDLSLGASTVTLSRGDIETFAQGSNSGFNQIMIRVPGVSLESSGQVHFRQEDPYYQYYINGILLPRAINGFGADIDTRFVREVSFKVGALPAQYAWGNYGIVAIQTESGTSLKGGEVSVYGGSFGTFHPSVSMGASNEKSDAYVTASSLRSNLGIENPTPAASALHDQTEQFRVLGSYSREITKTGRLSFLFSGFHGDFQIPNNPGQVSNLEFARGAANFPVADSARLDENQTEQSYYGILAYHASAGDLSYQIAQVNRYSGVLFRPDVNGDLYFNGVASRVFRDILTNGLQADFTLRAADAHTVRGGLLFNTAWARSHNRVAVFAAEDDDINPVNGKWVVKAPPFTITDGHRKRGFDSTWYLQDEWRASERMTVNFGGRYDRVSAYVREDQISPRLSAVYQVPGGTMLHAGYARYFIPPPLENVSPTSVEKFFGQTTNSPELATSDPVKCERSHYFDVGLTHGFSPEFTVGVDAYLKRTTNQIDDGQFGAANIFSPYNFAEGKTSGVEVSASYVRRGFSAYVNLAVSQARRRQIVSSQFQFEQEELDYLATHEVYSDQNQFFTGSAGLALERGPVTFHADIIYGSGMRSGFANRGTLPAYYPANIGLEYHWKTSGRTQVRMRFDLINAFDQSYVLNDGTGIGVGAPRYGARRGFFGGISCEF